MTSWIILILVVTFAAGFACGVGAVYAGLQLGPREDVEDYAEGR